MEHLEGVIDKPETEMSPQELQLHYFKMHDYDGNDLLDGLELSTAITHVHKEVGHGVQSRGIRVAWCPVYATGAVLVSQQCCHVFHSVLACLSPPPPEKLSWRPSLGQGFSISTASGV